MNIESVGTTDPRNGIARHWRIGGITIEWYVERPPQSWLKFDSNLSIRWYDE